MLCPVHPRAERVLFVVLVNAFWHCVVFVSTHVFFFTSNWWTRFVGSRAPRRATKRALVLKTKLAC